MEFENILNIGNLGSPYVAIQPPDESSIAGFYVDVSFSKFMFEDNEDNHNKLTKTISVSPDASSWLTIDNSGLKISGTPAVNTDVNNYTVTITCVDKDGNSVNAYVNLEIKENEVPQIITPVPNGISFINLFSYRSKWLYLFWG